MLEAFMTAVGVQHVWKKRLCAILNLRWQVVKWPHQPREFHAALLVAVINQVAVNYGYIHAVQATNVTVRTDKILKTRFSLGCCKTSRALLL
jgi:hypothetical protein